MPGLEDHSLQSTANQMTLTTSFHHSQFQLCPAIDNRPPMEFYYDCGSDGPRRKRIVKR